jgi:CheY-like chemotaxis protein
MTRVLIIDDCEDFREMVYEILDDAGYAVEVADGPETALAHCEKWSFDLFLCDLVLPDQEDEYADDDSDSSSAMVGVHTIQELSKRFPGTPVVAVSGELTGAPLAAMESFGAVRCLSKPFGRDELLSAIKGALGQ